MRMRRLAAFSAIPLALCILAVGVVIAVREMDVVEKARHARTPRATQHPASTAPDQICLTWSGDPRTTQTVQWRTSPAIADGAVEFHEKAVGDTATGEVAALQLTLEDPLVVNDPVNHRFTAALTGLKPGHTYTYRTGSKEADSWSPWAEFTTAPETVTPFSFIYLGDPQIGFDFWGQLMETAFTHRHDAAFYIVAGDLVNKGNNRDNWDLFFDAGSNVFAQRPIIPTIGNHEMEPFMYLDMFTLPEDGPPEVPPERAYSFAYSNALFVVLDSNLSARAQRAWLEEQLANSTATWKFAVYHHPAYSSADNRDNSDVRKYWCDLFDTYHVDIAFQGHDHAYLRTHPMRDGKAVPSPAEGTYYIVSVSGTKYYEQEDWDYTERGFANTSTYQVIYIETGNGNRLTYRAYDIAGNVLDEFVIDKP